MKSLGCRAAWMTAAVFFLLGAAQARCETTGLCLKTCASCESPAGEINDCSCEACRQSVTWSDTACCEPLWTVTADALFLDRSDPGEIVLIENTVNPAENLNAADLDFGVHTGVDLALMRRLDWNTALEIRYLGVDQWSAEASIPTTADDLLRWNTAVPLFTVAGTSIDARYTSQLHSFEVNGLHDWNERITLLAGFRYLELDEHLRATLIDAVAPFSLDVTTRNRLYGFQVGGRIRFWESCRCDACGCSCEYGRLTIDGIGKAGIYGNQPARLAAASTSKTGPPIVGLCPCQINSSLPVSARPAFVGDLGVSATYRLRNSLSVRGGYRLLWVDGVALASDQVAVTAFLPPALAPRPAIDMGTVFYHGAFVGLQYQW